VIDPFKGVGIPELKAAADIVFCSHSLEDLDNIKSVLGKQGESLESFVGSKSVKGISVKSVASFYDDAAGSKRGKNSICSFNLDGIQFCHLVRAVVCRTLRCNGDVEGLR